MGKMPIQTSRRRFGQCAGNGAEGQTPSDIIRLQKKIQPASKRDQYRRAEQTGQERGNPSDLISPQKYVEDMRHGEPGQAAYDQQ